MSLLVSCDGKLLTSCDGKLLVNCGPKLLCDVTGMLSFVFSGPLTFYPDLCFQQDSPPSDLDYKVEEVPTGFTIPPNIPKATAVGITPIGKLKLAMCDSYDCTCVPPPGWWEAFGIPTHPEFTDGFFIGWDIRTIGGEPTFLVWIWANTDSANMCLRYVEIPCVLNPAEGALPDSMIVSGCSALLGEVPPAGGSVQPICNGGTLTVSVP
jgi:hypothetical protein